jgi:four helix bundle protein
MKRKLVQSHEQLIVWQKGIELVTCTYQITDTFPPSERFGLTQQLRRAAVSVVANIAEGWRRSSRGELRHHLSIARGSLKELETLFVISERLGMVTSADLVVARGYADEVSRMLTTLRHRLS